MRTSLANALPYIRCNHAVFAELDLSHTMIASGEADELEKVAAPSRGLHPRFFESLK